MKTKFTLCLFFALLTGSFLQAQTKIIAHKSHSGKAATFNIHSAHNFGLSPIIHLDTLVRLADSVFVEIMHEQFSKSAWKDTVLYSSSNKNYYRKFNYYNRSLEELEAEMPKTVFIGFEEAQEQKSYPYLVPFIIPKQSDVPVEKGQQLHFKSQKQPQKKNSSEWTMLLFGAIFFLGLSISYSTWKAHTSNGLLAKN